MRVYIDKTCFCRLGRMAIYPLHKLHTAIAVIKSIMCIYVCACQLAIMLILYSDCDHRMTKQILYK